MKALVYTGPQSLELRDVPDPQPGPGEALVRVEAVGICGSDMHAWLGHDERRPAPLILGHEVAGTLSDGRAVALELRPGEATFFSGLLVHGSGRNRSDHFRRAISAHFISATCTSPPPDWRDNPYVVHMEPNDVHMEPNE